jgi:hypothetical protein
MINLSYVASRMKTDTDSERMIGDPVFSIQLSDDCMRLFRTNRRKFLKKLHKELMEHPASIGEMVGPFCTGLRETFEDNSINIEPCDVEVDDKGIGKAYISWLAFRDWGCRDQAGPVDYNDEFRFSIDLKSGCLTFYVDYPPQREPDEF